MKYIYNMKEDEEVWRKKFSNIHEKMNISKYLKDSKIHLDFGCGLGAFTYLLAQKYPSTMCYGTDVDEKMLYFANQKYQLKNLSFSPQKKFRYDSISCLYVLHHIDNTGKELKKLYDSLNKYGKIFILEFKKTEPEKFWKIYAGKYHTQAFEEYYRVHNRWSKEEFEKMCKKAGFKTIILKDHGDFWFVYVGEKMK